MSVMDASPIKEEFQEFLDSTPNPRINKIPTKVRKVPNYSGKKLLQQDSPDYKMLVNPITGHTKFSK